MKLHLGCGQVHLDDYVNIDFPLSEHSLQTYSVADEFADVTKLRYKPGDAEEVRNHHFFEHFIRPQALGLISSWYSWLKIGGKLHIEVPDFNRSAKLVLSHRTKFNEKSVALRHIFGSNEAPWAVHYEGWSKQNLETVLSFHGFNDISFEYSGYLSTRNITVTALRSIQLSQKALRKLTKDYLTNFLVDAAAEGEQHLLDIWMQAYDEQVALGWAAENALGSKEPAAQLKPAVPTLPASQLNWDNCEPKTNGEYWWIESQAYQWKTVFDIGANRGEYTQKLLKTNPALHIYSFEPNESAAKFIPKNKNTTVLTCAVGDNDGQLNIHINIADDSQSSAYRQNSKTKLKSLPQITLDSFIKKEGLKHIDFIKIDTEGHELAVLKGAKNVLEKQLIDCFQFEYGGTYEDSGTTLRQVFDLLNKNYLIFHLLPGGLLPTKWVDSLETYRYSNWVAIARKVLSE